MTATAADGLPIMVDTTVAVVGAITAAEAAVVVVFSLVPCWAPLRVQR
jgi:hypothetical protein